MEQGRGKGKQPGGKGKQKGGTKMNRWNKDEQVEQSLKHVLENR